MTTEQKPNYRIYDRTGGGARQDIYAPDLDTAIEMGRAWIEDGDWSDLSDCDKSNYPKPGTITELPCCVREIVYVPDLRSIEALPGVQYAETLKDTVIEVCVEGDEYNEKLLPGRILRTIVDIDGDTVYIIDMPNIPQMIDDHGTDYGQCWDCMGQYVQE